MIEIRSGRVLLRAFRADEIDALYDAHLASTTVVGTFDRERVRRRVERSGAWVDGGLDLAVDGGGALVGSIGVRSGRGVLPSGVCEWGIELWPASRGAGLGTEVVELLTSWLHANGFPRVQAGTSVANAPMRRVLEKCGYEHEGTMRSFMPEAGRRADFALYAHVGGSSAPPTQ